MPQRIVSRIGGMGIIKSWSVPKGAEDEAPMIDDITQRPGLDFGPINPDFTSKPGEFTEPLVPTPVENNQNESK